MRKELVFVLMLLLISNSLACITYDSNDKPKYTPPCTPSQKNIDDLLSNFGLLNPEDLERSLEFKYDIDFSGDLKGNVQYDDFEETLTVAGTLIPNDFRGGVAVSGNQVTLNNQATLTTGEGLEQKADKTIIKKAETLKNEPKPEEPKMEAKNVENAEVSPDKWYMGYASEITVTDTTTGQTYTGTNVQGFQMTTGDNPQISFDHSDDWQIGNSHLLNVNDFLSGLDFTYNFDSASEFRLGSMHFRHLCKSNFEVKGNVLIKARLCSNIDNNIFTLPNPIPQIGNTININANKSKNIDIEYTKLVVQNNIPKIALQFQLDKGVNMNFTTTGMPNIKLRAKENQANVLIVQDGLTNFEFNDIKLECNQNDFSEIVDTTKKSKLGLQMQNCLGYVILSPIASPGGKYTYDDKKIKTRSFGFYNPGTENYEIGFKKTQSFFDWREFEKIKEGYSFGYVDFTNQTFNLNGVIEFLKYPDKPDEVNEIDYMRFPISFMKTIFYSENNNSNQLKFDINLVNVEDIKIINKEPEATTRNGIFEIHENNRYLIPIWNIEYPETIKRYETTSYKPIINIQKQTLDMDKVKVHKYDTEGAKQAIQRTYTVLSLEQWLTR